MPNDPDSGPGSYPGGGYGGTAPGNGICWISPSDLAGQVFNLMSRIAQLESDVALLKAANVTANQTSDLSGDLGNVTAGGIVLPSGNLPAADGQFSGLVQNGTTFQGYQNGVPIFTFDTTGGGTVSTTAATVTGFGGSGSTPVLDYAILEINTTGGNVSHLRGVSLLHQPALNPDFDYWQVQIAKDGIYWIYANQYQLNPSSDAVIQSAAFIRTSEDPGSYDLWQAYNYWGNQGVQFKTSAGGDEDPTANTIPHSAIVGRLAYLHAGAWIKATFISSSTATTLFTVSQKFSCIMLTTL